MLSSSLMCGTDKSWIIALVNASLKEKTKKKAKDHGHHPVNGWRSTRTFSQLLSIPTVGKNPPFGIDTCLVPTIFPFLVKNTWKL